MDRESFKDILKKFSGGSKNMVKKEPKKPEGDKKQINKKKKLKKLTLINKKIIMVITEKIKQKD